MRKSSALVLLLFTVVTAMSQPLVFEWAAAFDGTNPAELNSNSNGRSIAIDAQGNIYSAGYFTHNIDFDPGAGVYTVAPAGTAISGIYISKLSPTRQFIWTKHITSTVDLGAIELALDNTGNVYLASAFTTSTDMDPGPGQTILTPAGAADVFVVKLDQNGSFLWAKQVGGPGGAAPFVTTMTMDPAGNLILCGQYNLTVDFDPGPDQFDFTCPQYFEEFIIKLNGNGELVWARRIGNLKTTETGIGIVDVTCDAAGNIYTTGTFSGTCDFDPSTSDQSLVATGFNDGFVLKWDNDGQFVWVKQLGSAALHGFVQPAGIDIDRDNNVYTTGTFVGTQDFDPGAGQQDLTSRPGSIDCYILKLTAPGDFAWVKAIGATGVDLASSIVVDKDDQVYMTGTYFGTVDFDPGPGEAIQTDLKGEPVLVKFDSDGNFKFAARLRLQGSGSGYAIAGPLVADSEGNIYTTGHFIGNFDFDPGANVTGINSLKGAPYVLKLARCKNTTYATLNITTCYNYTLNDETYDQSGVYTQRTLNVGGCDSIITLNLVITVKRRQQLADICEGESFYAGGARQTLSGIYTDTITTAAGCDSVIITQLTVNPAPHPLLGPDKDLCRGAMLEVSPGAFNQYQWQDGSTAAQLLIQSPGLYWVRVGNGGCEASDTILIPRWIEGPSNFLPVLDSICPFEEIALAASGLFETYHWSTGSTQPRIMVTTPGTYSLRVTAANGCIGEDSIAILAQQRCLTVVYVPTAFTPNADGKNDLFRATTEGPLQWFRLQVYNRTGQLLFETTDPAKGWDGRYKNIEQASATFAWSCRYRFKNGMEGQQRGTVTLIR